MFSSAAFRNQRVLPRTSRQGIRPSCPREEFCEASKACQRLRGEGSSPRPLGRGEGGPALWMPKGPAPQFSKIGVKTWARARPLPRGRAAPPPLGEELRVSPRAKAGDSRVCTEFGGAGPPTLPTSLSSKLTRGKTSRIEFWVLARGFAHPEFDSGFGLGRDCTLSLSL